MAGNDLAALEHLHRAGDAADLDHLADEAERHAVLPSLKGDEIERLGHSLGQWRQQAPFLGPGLCDRAAGQRRSAARAANLASVQACSSARSRKLRR